MNIIPQESKNRFNTCISAAQPEMRYSSLYVGSESSALSHLGVTAIDRDVLKAFDRQRHSRLAAKSINLFGKKLMKMFAIWVMVE